MFFFHMSKMSRLLTKSGRNSPDLSGLANMKMVMRWHFSFVYFHLLSIHKFLIVSWFGCFPLHKSDSLYLFSRSRIRVLVRRNWISCGYLARKRRKHSTWLAKDLKGASTVRVTRWRRPSDYKELMMASFLTWKTIQPSRLQRYERIAMTSMKMTQF